jgi:prolyl-tRNA synthetase
MSRLFVRTLRDDPADADVASHRLLVRAGYLRRAAPGIHCWLPLGWMVLRNVERVVREEMVRAGFQEVHFPALLPRGPYEATGRWSEYGENLFRLRDRRGTDYLLGPTHEEMFTLLVKDIYRSRVRRPDRRPSRPQPPEHHTVTPDSQPWPSDIEPASRSAVIRHI